MRALFKGVGKFSRYDRLEGFESVTQITILDSLDIPSRLEEFSVLRDGWLEGHGVVPRSEGIKWLSNIFDQYFPDDLILPYLYPTEDGQIQAEWSIKFNEISLEINLETHQGHWHCLNMNTQIDESQTLNLDNKEQWDWIAEKIKALNGGSR